MDLHITSQMLQGYLLITARGMLHTLEEEKKLFGIYYEMAREHGTNNILVDESLLEVPCTLENKMAIVDDYLVSLPFDIRQMKVAWVMMRQYKAVTDFWETYSHNMGFPFKVFYSMWDAVAYMTQTEGSIASGRTWRTMSQF